MSLFHSISRSEQDWGYFLFFFCVPPSPMAVGSSESTKQIAFLKTRHKTYAKAQEKRISLPLFLLPKATLQLHFLFLSSISALNDSMRDPRPQHEFESAPEEIRRYYQKVMLLKGGQHCFAIDRFWSCFHLIWQSCHQVGYTKKTHCGHGFFVVQV